MCGVVECWIFSCMHATVAYWYVHEFFLNPWLYMGGWHLFLLSPSSRVVLSSSPPSSSPLLLLPLPLLLLLLHQSESEGEKERVRDREMARKRGRAWPSVPCVDKEERVPAVVPVARRIRGDCVGSVNSKDGVVAHGWSPTARGGVYPNMGARYTPL